MTLLYQLFGTSLFVLKHYVALAILLLPAWAVGRRLLRRVPFPSEPERHVVAIAVGLGSLATALMCLALLHLFRPGWILGLALASQIFAWTSWRDAPGMLRRWLSSEVDGRTVLLVVGLALLGAPLLVLPLYPPFDVDAVVFHLPFARAIAESHTITFFEDLRYPVAPALMEIQHAVALDFGDHLLPAQLHFSYLILVALLLYAWGRGEGRTRSGLWAALLWLGTPVAVYAGVAARVDCALAFFATATLYSLVRHRRSREPAWLYLAGACAGFSAASDYHGLFFLGVFLARTIFVAIRGRRRRASFATVALAFLVALPFYGYVVAYTGNPVFPFATKAFGISQWAYELEDAPLLDAGDPRRLSAEEIRTALPGDGPGRLVLGARGVGTLARDGLALFMGPSPFGKRTISPLFALLLPFALGGMFLSTETGALLITFGLFFVVWDTTGRDPGHLLAAIPILALASSRGLDRLLAWISRFNRSGGRLAAVLATMVLATTTATVSAQITWSQGELPVGKAARQAFVKQRFPVYPAIRFIDRRLGAVRTYAISLDPPRFYARGELLGGRLGPHRFRNAIALRDDLHRLAEWLRSLDAEALLVPTARQAVAGSSGRYPMPEPEHLPTAFELVYQDEDAAVYRLRTEGRAGSSGDSRGAGGR